MHTDDGNLWLKGTRGWEQLFSKKMLVVVREISELRNMSIAGYVWDLVDADIAEFRALRINKSFLEPQGPPAPPQEDIGSLQRKCRFRGEESQKIVALHQEDVPAPAIAKRLGCSVMKIHRVIHNYQRSKTRVPESIHVIIRKGPRAKSPRFNPSAERQI